MPSASPPFPIDTLTRAASAKGVVLQLDEHRGIDGGVVIEWIERLPQAPKGAAAEVVSAVVEAAAGQGKRVALACTGGLLEDYYARLGFVPVSASRDEETGDVDMLFEPSTPHPALARTRRRR